MQVVHFWVYLVPFVLFVRFVWNHNYLFQLLSLIVCMLLWVWFLVLVLRFYFFVFMGGQVELLWKHVFIETARLFEGTRFNIFAFYFFIKVFRLINILIGLLVILYLFNNEIFLTVWRCFLAYKMGEWLVIFSINYYLHL